MLIKAYCFIFFLQKNVRVVEPGFLPDEAAPPLTEPLLPGQGTFLLFGTVGAF